MGKKKPLPPFDQDLISAVRFGLDDAFQAALANAIREWPDPLDVSDGEWDQFKVRLSRLASAICIAASADTCRTIITTLLEHKALAARCLGIMCLPHRWNQIRPSTLPALAASHARIRSCLITALQSLPDAERRVIAEDWLSSTDPSILATAIHIFPASTPQETIAILERLRPQLHPSVQEAMIQRSVSAARQDSGAMFSAFHQWATDLRPGDVFILTRTLAQQPLRSDLTSCFDILSILGENCPASAEADRILGAIRALAREHEAALVHEQLAIWQSSSSRSLKDLAAKAQRRVQRS